MDKIKSDSNLKKIVVEHIERLDRREQPRNEDCDAILEAFLMNDLNNIKIDIDTGATTALNILEKIKIYGEWQIGYCKYVELVRPSC